MKRLLLAAAFALAATPSFADVPVHDWSGLNVGILADLGMQTANGPGAYGYEYGSYYGNVDVTHFTGGGGAKIGYNWQMGHIVIGADFDWSIMGGTAQGCDYEGYYCYKSKLDNYGTLRAKAGIAIDNGFFYATGGIAFVNRKDDVCYYPNCSGGYEYAYGQHSRSLGLALGAGFEYAISDSFSIDGEYLFIDAGQKSMVAPYYAAEEEEPYRAFFSSKYNVVRIGLNWYVH
jgi:outer membrane immunogenic protein